MALLLKYISKKVNASTLIEVLVASVLIIVIFAIASLSLNNILNSTIKSNTVAIENELTKLQYLYKHDKINENYIKDFLEWEIEIIKQSRQSSRNILLQATNSKTQKIIVKKVVYEID